MNSCIFLIKLPFSVLFPFILTLQDKYIITTVYLREAVIIITKVKEKASSFFVLAFVCVLLILIAARPEYFKESTREAVYVCLNSVIPSLFCFIVLTKIIVASGFAYVISKPFGLLFYKLSGLPPFCGGVYLLSFLSGFPAGAVAAADMYANNALTKSDAEKLAAFADNTGPALPVLLIGAGIFGDIRLGVIIYLIQITASLICVFVMRKRISVGYEPRFPEMRSNVLRAVTDSVEKAVKSVALLCAYVILFSVVCDCLSLLPAGYGVLSYIKPFIEIVSGSRSAVSACGTRAFIPVCGALSFGGICVHMQSAAICVPRGLSMKEHFRAKFLQSLLSMILASVFVIFTQLS